MSVEIAATAVALQFVVAFHLTESDLLMKQTGAIDNGILSSLHLCFILFDAQNRDAAGF
jgi:hypothetical protein